MAEVVDKEQKEFEQFYKTSLLWIKLRPLLKRGGLLLFFLVDTALLLFFFWSYLDYGVFDYFTDRAAIGTIIADSTDLRSVSEERAADGITEHETGVISLSGGRADFYSVVSNPNADWYVRFSYAFVYSGGQTEPVTGFLLPGEEEKTLVQLGVAVTGTPRTAQVVLTDVEWQRVDAHTIADYGTYAADRLNLTFDAVDFERDVDLNGSSIARSSFTITNHTAFGYWEPIFVVVLRRNNTIVGVTTTTALRLLAGESRSVSVNWFGLTPSANATEIEPVIDILDTAVFMPALGEASEDVRERVEVKD